MNAFDRSKHMKWGIRMNNISVDRNGKHFIKNTENKNEKENKQKTKKG